MQDPKTMQYRKRPVYEKETEIRETDKDGNTKVTSLHQTVVQSGNDEPDYIKVYTKMWCEFNNIPQKYHQLFLSLATRMTYADSSSPEEEGGQIVFTGGPMRDVIMKECGWASRDAYQKGLKALVEAGAIRKISRGCYQINPLYAGRGKWCYDRRLKYGGIKDLIVKFDFAKKTNNTVTLWVDQDDEKENQTVHRIAGTMTDDWDLTASNDDVSLIITQDNLPNNESSETNKNDSNNSENQEEE